MYSKYIKKRHVVFTPVNGVMTKRKTAKMLFSMCHFTPWYDNCVFTLILVYITPYVIYVKQIHDRCLIRTKTVIVF